MNIPELRRPLWALAGGLLLGFSGLVAAEPPSRAARLGYLSGTVSFSPAGQPDWVRAAVNRPLTTGDRLWTGSDARAELQIGGAALRMGPSTSMDVLNLDDRITQVQLSQGSLKIRVRSLGPRQTFEVATPNLAFTLRRPGEYRIEVDAEEDATLVMVSSGDAEVYGEGASYTVDSRRAFRFYGTDLSDYETLPAQRDDEFDRWSRERDRRGDNSISARYVSSEVVGYEDLDDNGSWRVDATYGSVWTPTRVSPGWTPYRDGHWSWVDPWGWTWVDDAPWGYAVSHYGRWAHIDGSWAWVPGPPRERAVYAPALVAFIGGKNFQISVSAGGTSTANVGWFPLAPREVYQPSYAVGPAYFDSINRSNAVIAPTTLTKVYNTTIVNNTTNVTNVTNVVYVNQQVAGAVVAVPTQTFVQAQPVAKAAVPVTRDVLVSAPVVRVASVAPVQQSVQGGSREAAVKPPVREHAIVARTAPPPAPLPFAAQQAQLAARPGTPIDASQRAQLKPAAPVVAAPKLSVVAATPAPTATALPPATAPGGRSPQARKSEAAQADGPRGDARRPDVDAAAGAQAEKGEAAKAAGAKAEEARAAGAKADEARAAGAKADEARAAGAKAEEAKAAGAKAEAARAGEARAEQARGQAAKGEAMKAEAARSDAAAAANAKAESARAEAAKADSARGAAAATAANAEAQKAAAARADATRAAEARAETTRASNARAEAGKADEARAERARAEAARAEAARTGAARAESAKADAAKAGRAKAEAARPADARKPPAAAEPPEARASGPKAEAESNAEDEKAKKRGRKP